MSSTYVLLTRPKTKADGRKLISIFTKKKLWEEAIEKVRNYQVQYAAIRLQGNIIDEMNLEDVEWKTYDTETQEEHRVLNHRSVIFSGERCHVKNDKINKRGYVNGILISHTPDGFSKVDLRASGNIESFTLNRDEVFPGHI